MMDAAADKIRIDDFRWLQQRLKAATATVLEDGRKFLAENRLAPLLWRHRLPGFAELFARLRQEPDGDLAKETLETLISSETWFFRDIYPFEQLRLEVLPALIAARGQSKRLRFWSAGCGPGQEPYSLAMLLRHHFPQLKDWDVKVVATDLLESHLERARSGLFSQQEINKGLPVVMLMKYFTQESLEWRLNQDLRDSMEFRVQRLDQAWDELPTFDVILLRNVLFHFDSTTRMDILSRVRDQLAVDGALILGNSESSDLKDGLEQVDCGKGWYYRRPAGAESVLRAS